MRRLAELCLSHWSCVYSQPHLQRVRLRWGEVAVPVLFRWEVGGGMGGDVMRAFTLTSRTP